ncbi:MAG: T9SS type A sorting domain-containing protein [Bacteroidota bacterium]
MQYLTSQNAKLTERSLLKKWAKLHARLERKLQSRSFYRLSLKKRQQLLEKLKKCYAQLLRAGISLKHTAVAGSMAMALVLGSTAQGQFIEQSGAANPLDGVNIGYFGTASFVDIDNDGDFDMFVDFYNDTSYQSTIRYFQNTGTPTNPAFVAQTGSANPFDGEVFSDLIFSSFVDIDGDGDVDAFIGGYYGEVTYYENTGTATSPTFTERTGMGNPLDGVDVGEYAFPAFADIDGDGDFDAFLGEYDQNINYYENTGTSTSPIFTERTGTLNPFDGIVPGGFLALLTTDLDEDGDTDFFIRSVGFTMPYSVSLDYFLNTGTTTSPNFVQQMPGDNPFNGLDVGEVQVPSFVDIDGDGDQDVFFSDYNGNFKYFRNGFPTSIFDSRNNDADDRLSDFYPNPSQDGRVNLNYAAEGFGQVEVSVFDRAGKVLNTQTLQVVNGNNQLSFDFSALSTGLYMVRFQEAGKAAFRKLVIE